MAFRTNRDTVASTDLLSKAQIAACVVASPASSNQPIIYAPIVYRPFESDPNINQEFSLRIESPAFLPP
jgi:hypothetical protein